MIYSTQIYFIMKLFSTESYSLGWLECLFAINRSFNESEASRFIELSKLLGQSIDTEIKEYLEKNHPSIKL